MATRTSAVFQVGLERLPLQLERFVKAETALLEAYGILEPALGAKHERTIKTIKLLIDLFESRHTAEPDMGYDVKSAE